MYQYYRNAEFSITQSGYGQWDIRATFNARTDKIVAIHYTDAPTIDALTYGDDRERRHALKCIYGICKGEYRNYYGRVCPRVNSIRGYVVNGREMTRPGKRI